jgi:ABC-type cobalamin/Fe3+-siderophores transport system ATPase subunit
LRLNQLAAPRLPRQSNIDFAGQTRNVAAIARALQRKTERLRQDDPTNGENV